MIVTVRGAKDNQLTKLLKMAVDSFANKLLSPQLIKNITLKKYPKIPRCPSSVRNEIVFSFAKILL